MRDFQLLAFRVIHHKPVVCFFKKALVVFSAQFSSVIDIREDKFSSLASMSTAALFFLFIASKAF